MVCQSCLKSVRWESEAHSTSDDDSLTRAAESLALGRDGGISIVVPGRHWGGDWWLHCS